VLKDTKRVDHQRFTAEGEKLFRHRAAHAETSSSGRDESHGVVTHVKSVGCLQSQYDGLPTDWLMGEA
jgi:hypothetical protein